jgi:lipopolysaccharide/colanic/teichoic acid biosynthesis glycosyltransferase
VGKDGKLFRMFKLRTMYTDAEQATGAVWAGQCDPRVIPLCRWMRRSHMDELPQLVNVIRGDMSLVGPRPERPEILADLEKVYPDIRRRLTVRPGITGLAQVRNGYDTTIEGVRNKLRADLEYIQRRRWSLEIKILAATLSKLNDRTAR